MNGRRGLQEFQFYKQYMRILEGEKMKLVDVIKGNLKEIVARHCSPGFSGSAAWEGIHEGHVLSMDDEAILLLSETVRSIMKLRPSIKERFAEKYVEDRLIDIIFSCHAVPSLTLDAKLLKETKKLIRKLQRTTETWIFLVPVVNLGMTGIKKMSIGEVDFYDLNPKTLKYLKSKFSIRGAHQKLLNRMQSGLVKNNINVLAVVKATAGETQKAQAIALFKVESSLNILRLFDFTRQIGIQREFFTAFGREDIYHQNLRTKAVGASHGGPPPARFFSFSVDKTKLNLMRKKGKLSEFNKLLRGQLPTKLAKKIAMSIHWYGLAVKDKKEVDKFIKLIVALESLLLGKKDRLKKQSLADRVAFILGRDGKTREDMYELVDQMYSIRSEIVHEGKHDISEEDTSTLIAVVRTLIFSMIPISAKLQSLEAIDERIRKIKFGSRLRGI
jgi:hypothetical protein